MRRTRLLCAIGVSLWSAMVIGSQATSTAALPEALRASGSSVTVPASFALGVGVVYAAYLLSH